MDEARSKDRWDHSTALIVTLRKVMGDKDAKFEAIHPATANKHNASRLKQLKQQTREQGEREHAYETTTKQR